ncbi:hypothetical protein ACT7DZ_09790 [Bacillus cereus]
MAPIKKVYVPEEEDVAVKEYIRMLGDFKNIIEKNKTTDKSIPFKTWIYLRRENQAGQSLI